MGDAASVRSYRTPGLIDRLAARWGKLAPALLMLVVLVVYPVSNLLALSFQKDGAWSLDLYARMFSSPVYLRVMTTTLSIAAWTTLFTVLISYPLAFFISSMSSRAKDRMMFFIMVSFWASFLIRTFGWMVLLNKTGPINQLLLGIGLIDEPLEMLYSRGAVVTGIVHAMTPLCIMTMLPVMENIDRNLSRAGMVLGGRPGSVFWRIFFPLSMPGVTAAALLVFITALGFFIVPAFLGSTTDTMLTQLIIDQVQEYMNWAFAGALSVLLLVSALVIFWLYDRILGLSALAGTAEPRRESGWLASGAAFLSSYLLAIPAEISDRLYVLAHRMSGGRPEVVGRVLRKVLIVATLLFLLLPGLLMIPVSFTEGSRMTWPPEGFSLQWYEALFSSQIWTQAAVRSVIVALASAVLAMLIGVPVAFALARQSLPGKTAILALILSPLIIPRIVLAVALFYLYARIGIVGTYFGLIIGHAVIALPYVVITSVAVQKHYDMRYDQAAWGLGARPRQTLYRITLPQMKGGLLSAFLFAMITSFDELTLALFVTGGLTTTLPKQMWDDALNVATPTLAALSTLLLIFVAVLTLISQRLQSR